MAGFEDCNTVNLKSLIIFIIDSFVIYILDKSFGH